MPADPDSQAAAAAALELVDALLDALQRLGKLSPQEADMIVEVAAERSARERGEEHEVTRLLRLLGEERRRREH